MGSYTDSLAPGTSIKVGHQYRLEGLSLTVSKRKNRLSQVTLLIPGVRRPDLPMTVTHLSCRSVDLLVKKKMVFTQR